MDSTRCLDPKDEAQKPLSQEAADAITALNQHNSPLLRLPGELRNCIFGHVLGDLVIHSSNDRSDSNRLAHAMDVYDVRKGVVPDRRFRSTCRVIDAETRLLPFALGTFEIHPVKLDRFLTDLTTAQLNAITTFKIGTSVAATKNGGDTGRNLLSQPMRLAYAWSFELRLFTAGETIATWSGLHTLARMKGLKRVVVSNAYVVGLCALAEPHEVTEKIRAYVGQRTVEIIFEAGPE
ncbi:hypothetical protein CC86DRAFT_401946 [Ophiobolus disseminans]|uniref:Uncharacterized protein n=1 Tax=Ophiobolus disseminans TaxID=1469910 RepID=A0A6A7AFE4_9PLEO|nr:hypothetical protein CC86DRAFT_401946 [Ophiobolus disseminans]